MAKTKRKHKRKRNRSLRNHQRGGNIFDQIKGFGNRITNFLNKGRNRAQETQKKFTNAQQCVQNCYQEFGSPDSESKPKEPMEQPKPIEQPKPMEPMEEPKPVEQPKPVIEDFNNPLQKREDNSEEALLLTGGKRNKRKHKKKTKKRKKVKRKRTHKKRKRKR